ncbi:MAG: hypothetical protein ACYC5S_03340 [Thiobacillus sp.]
MTRTFAFAPLRAAWLIAFLVLAASAYASGPAPERKAAKFEIEFMIGLASHHPMAVHRGAS